MIAALPIAWAHVHAAACDDAGNVYFLIAESEWKVVSLDRERRLRWTTTVPEGELYGNAIAVWDANGALVLWRRGGRAALRISCGDGSLIGTLDPVRGEGHVDLGHARSLAVDTDGSLLVVTRGVLRRFASDGAPMPLWEGASTMEVALSQPKEADHAFAIVGWDGATWVATFREKGVVWGESWGEHPARWRRYDRRGHTLTWGAPDVTLHYADSAWVDRDGHAYVLSLVVGTYARVFRYANDMSHLEPWIVSRDGPQSGPTRDETERLLPTRPAPSAVRGENVVCVAPDGAVWAFGSHGQLRCFDANGEPTFVSDASLAADANGV